jgi:hypothetical protein
MIYRVQTLGPPDSGYQVEEVMGTTMEGDGTVPKNSASGHGKSVLEKSVLNVEHAYMCNSSEVADILSTII